jgi:hypothetical protein
MTIFRRMCMMCLRDRSLGDFSYPEGLRLQVCKSCMSKGESEIPSTPQTIARPGERPYTLPPRKGNMPPPKRKRAWRYCPFCDEGIKKKDRICPKCGVAIPQDAPPTFPKTPRQLSEDERAANLDGVGSYYEHARYKSDHKD